MYRKNIFLSIDFLLKMMLLPYVSIFQNGLTDLLTPNGSLFMTGNVKAYICDLFLYIGKSYSLKITYV